MTKFSYIYLLAAISCSIIDAASPSSPAPLAGTKHGRSSSPVISAASGRAVAPTHPTTPTRPQKTVKKYSPGRLFHNSAVREISTPLREQFPDGLDTAAKIGVAISLLQEASTYGSPIRREVGKVLNGMADYEVASPALKAAAANGTHLSPGRVRSDIVSGHYDAALATGKKPVGMPQLRSAIAGAGVSVTPGLHWDHIASPQVKNNGTILGGHIGSAYESDHSFAISDRVYLPGGQAAIFEIKSSDPSKTKISVKSVLLGGAASQVSASKMLCDAEIIASSGRRGRLDLLRSGDTVFGGFRSGIDSYDYNTNFVCSFVGKDALSGFEVILGERSGIPVTVSSEALRAQVRAQAHEDDLVRSGGKGKESLTVFSDAFGPRAVGGVEIPGMPSHVVVELTDEMKRTLPLSPVPAYNLPAKVGSQVKELPALSACAVSPISMSSLGSLASGSGSSSSSAAIGKP